MLKNNIKNHIWVIGSPRSGTSILTDIIGQYTDLRYNEPWQEFPISNVKNWEFKKKYKSLVFKYCINWKYADIINNKFKISRFLYILRNPCDIVYSMFFPKKNSYPYRDWKEYGHKEERFNKIINHWYEFTKGCFDLQNNQNIKYKLILYEKINEQIEELSNFIRIKLDKKNNLINKNLDSKELNKLEYLWKKYPIFFNLRKKIENKYYK